MHQIEVVHAGLQRTFYFPVNRWLKKGAGNDGLSSCRADVELAPPSALTASGGASSLQAVTYKLVINTGSALGAGTDAEVAATVFGQRGDTGPRRLGGAGGGLERGKVRWGADGLDAAVKRVSALG